MALLTETQNLLFMHLLYFLMLWNDREL